MLEAHWFERLKHDPVCRDLIKTQRHFMEEESMDVKETTDAAVDRRKIFLNRVFAVAHPNARTRGARK